MAVFTLRAPGAAEKFRCQMEGEFIRPPKIVKPMRCLELEGYIVTPWWS